MMTEAESQTVRDLVFCLAQTQAELGARRQECDDHQERIASLEQEDGSLRAAVSKYQARILALEELLPPPLTWPSHRALVLIRAERHRQLSECGWSTQHDDTHTMGELALAAACYAWAGTSHVIGHGSPPLAPAFWPFGGHAWKPAPDPRRNLVRAGALIVAEMERMDREKSKPRASHD